MRETNEVKTVNNMSNRVKLEHKKAFIKWFTETQQMRRRESLWILNYLMNHDIVLNKTHFVEYAHTTPRAIKIAAAHTQGRSFLFYKDGIEFEDPEKAFHEIRMNWHEPLYLEVDFKDKHLSPSFVKVLEDNPYAPWNDRVPADLIMMAEDALDEFQLTVRKEEIKDLIDQALVEDDKSTFYSLSQELIDINHYLEQLNISNS